jgi:hypothetical protein
LFKLKLANFRIKSILVCMRKGYTVHFTEVVAGGAAIVGLGLVVSAIGYGLAEIALRDGHTLDKVAIHGRSCDAYPNVGEEIGDIKAAQTLVDELGGVTSRVCYVGETSDGAVWYSTGF